MSAMTLLRVYPQNRGWCIQDTVELLTGLTDHGKTWVTILYKCIVIVLLKKSIHENRR